MGVKLDEMLSVEDVAQRLRVSEGTVYLWARSGRLKSYKFGTRLRFDVEDVIDFGKRGAGERR